MNRRQRRSAAVKSGTSPIQSVEDIPLSRSFPEPSGAQARPQTLYELADQRQREFASKKTNSSSWSSLFPSSNTGSKPASTKFVTIDPGGSISATQSEDADDDVGDSDSPFPILETLFLALPLLCIHFTLSVLTAHQYAQTLEFQPLIISTVFVAFPFLMFLIHLCHGHLIPVSITSGLHVPTIVGQLCYLVAANIAGCYLIHVTNDRGYYAVMKRAPSIGTLWVWTVLELGLIGALGGLLGPGLFAWYYGYGFF